MDRRQFLTRAGMAGGALAATPVLGGCSPPPSAGNLRRLGTVNARNPDAPATLAERGSKSALVIGGGIAGLSAALELGEAGYAVSVCEADSVLGGRLAARELDPGVGRTFSVDHGLHM